MQFDFQLIAGGAVGAILLGAAVFVPLARNVALAAAAGAIVTSYLRGGISDILTTAGAVQQQLLAQPSFAVGVLGGMFLVAIIATQRSRRVSD